MVATPSACNCLPRPPMRARRETSEPLSRLAHGTLSPIRGWSEAEEEEGGGRRGREEGGGGGMAPVATAAGARKRTSGSQQRSKSPKAATSPCQPKAPSQTRRQRQLRSQSRSRWGLCSCVAGSAAAFLVLYSAAFAYIWALIEAPLPVPDNLFTSGPVKFAPACLSKACPVLGEGFFFGLATAPAHVEDSLDDSWLDFAEVGRVRYEDVSSAKPGDEPFDGQGLPAPPVKAWKKEAVPQDRLRFWSDPETEIQLAAGAGVEALRLGVDWGRLVPREPLNGTHLAVNRTAVEGYKRILRLAKDKYGLRTMVTLFHHSFPKWGIPWGGWTHAKAIDYFAEFAELAVTEFGPWVDYWVTFNEPTVFCLLTYCVGVWPPGFVAHPLHIAKCFTPVGEFNAAMGNIARAHLAAYQVLRSRSSTPVGIAHNTGFMTPASVLDLPAQQYFNFMTLFSFVDAIAHRLDFCGLNYYSQEFVSVVGLLAMPGEEYSEAGRAVYPDGLYRILKAFHQRYRARNPGLRYLITENGMADRTDLIRGPYLVEHLLAIHTAIQEGVPVDGYFHWTISDNWEWADGYCPMFGLAAVDRANNLSRTLRPSYHLFKKIVTGRIISEEMRSEQWGALQASARDAQKRPFCRSIDSASRMGSVSLDHPIERPYATKDWRFGHYKQPDLLMVIQQTKIILNCWLTDLLAFIPSFK